MRILTDPESWLDGLAHPTCRLTVSHQGYTDHGLRANPINDRSLDVHLIWFVVDRGFQGSIGADRVDEALDGLLSG